MSMTDEVVTVIENRFVAKDTYRMMLRGAMSREFKPGQFVNVEIEGFTLRRPISISSYQPKEQTFVLLYRIMGEGTAKMAELKAGSKIKVFGPLGNSFPMERGKAALLIGGGAGVGPLVQTAKELQRTMNIVYVVLGFPTKADVYAVEDFVDAGAEVFVSTDDGTFGFKGNVLELAEAKGLKGEWVYACGPKRMLKAVEEKYDKGYISLDVRMACGMGACMACVCKDKKDPDKYHRVCKEGPVFPIGKVVIE